MVEAALAMPEAMMVNRIIHRIRPGYPRYLTQDRLRKLREDFNLHRWNARVRGIEFTLSFGEWLGIWIASRKLLRRGCRRGQYVMARIGDRGAYAVGNVNIVLATENIAEARRGKPGTPHSAETRCLLSLNSILWWSARREAARTEARP
ncbi:hypothetical protein KMZ29_02580 [Bradyrhizobium sediminis]|uniref:Uncharacterized protein n=1 Tax=Bradyrhizobium sediminis TaxID=2840469 RepID=A0A975NEH8_9BRAD|nr:hypothetical protein [Bradyrhizobium sediminis]QWG13643.1 hypothetical protein KMZ29_02580 [Bradyrhizobium sediminis]